uniref:Zinc-finger of transposase IS204/IS1001/IS1096/IS1165 n=1 Tax=Candidatus Kentrum sp. LFY TaxID=2126342 RepID=A0A450WMW7_9GAMM|nr:MAG: hypothetical protein BECKLFY1418C_GA0070996_10435 [Candidatus Kentron sp. LFY]
MQIKTILNRVQKFKSFVYGKARWIEDAKEPTIEVEIQPRKNSRPICPKCGRRRSGYDTQPVRKFVFIPMLGYQGVFPWAKGKHVPDMRSMRGFRRAGPGT